MSDALQSVTGAHAAMRDRGALPAPLTARQDAALARFVQKGFPSLSDEDWRYTNLRSFKDAPLTAANAGSRYDDSIAFDAWHLHADPAALRIGGNVPQGITALRLHDAIEQNHPLLQHLGSIADNSNAAMSDLNDAFATDALLLHVHDNCEVDQPLLIDWQLPEQANALSSPRVLLVAGKHSKVTLIERRVGRGSYANSLTEIIATPGAHVRYVDVSRQRSASHSITRVDMHIDRDARVDAYSLALGGTLTRNDVHARLAAPGACVSLRGTFVAGESQLIDNHTTIDHLSPDTHSVENYRGIIARAGHGVFNGKVIVHPDAQRITSAQSNDNLLLDDSAEIDTKPELQIYADDVRCSHGATIGRLDDQAMFYLRSRGIDATTAQRLLLNAFAAQTLDGLDDSLRDALVSTLTGYLTEHLTESLT